MVELKGNLVNLQYTIDNQQLVTFKITNDFTQFYDDLVDKKLSISLKQFREKRSHNANSFLWHLCNQLGNKMRISKEEVYFNLLRNYGQSEIVSVVSKADVKGILKYYDEVGEGFVGGKKFIHYKAYRGSSEYDTYEMSVLLDGTVCEAKEQGLQVYSASELDLLKREWDNAKTH